MAAKFIASAPSFSKLPELGLPEIEIANTGDMDVASRWFGETFAVEILPDGTALGQRGAKGFFWDDPYMEYVSRKIGEEQWTYLGEGWEVGTAARSEAHSNAIAASPWNHTAVGLILGLSMFGALLLYQRSTKSSTKDTKTKKDSIAARKNLTRESYRKHKELKADKTGTEEPEEPESKEPESSVKPEPKKPAKTTPKQSTRKPAAKKSDADSKDPEVIEVEAINIKPEDMMENLEKAKKTKGKAGESLEVRKTAHKNAADENKRQTT